MSALLQTALHEHQISFPSSTAGIGISDVHNSNTTHNADDLCHCGSVADILFEKTSSTF